MKNFLFLLFSLSSFLALTAAEPDEKNWSWAVNGQTLRISFEFPKEYYAYAGNTGPVLIPNAKAVKTPEVVKKKDLVLDAEQEVYQGGKVYTWEYDLKSLTYPLSLSVEWQLCKEPEKNGGEAICLLPGKAGLAVFADIRFHGTQTAHPAAAASCAHSA